MNGLLAKLLDHYGFDVDTQMPNGQTTLEFLEGVVMGAMDDIQAVVEGDDIRLDDSNFCDDEPDDQFRDDVEADADVLRSAGYGTDEDYGGGYYDDERDFGMDG